MIDPDIEQSSGVDSDLDMSSSRAKIKQEYLDGLGDVQLSSGHFSESSINDNIGVKPDSSTMGRPGPQKNNQIPAKTKGMHSVAVHLSNAVEKDERYSNLNLG